MLLRMLREWVIPLFGRGFVILALLAPLASTQSRFATTVVQYSPGPGGGLFDPLLALGGPQGGGLSMGSVHVTSLGVRGSLTLGFATDLVDGPGADLMVFENAFLAGDGVFSEVAFVEVSSDGVHFARFPARYGGPAGPLPAFGTAPLGSYSGLTGGLPVPVNVLTNTLDPFEPVEAGGEAFDLYELRDAPLVRTGLVDLAALRFVRLVDVEAGIDLDGTGQPIWDNGGPGSSADIDAVALIHHAGNVSTREPLLRFEVLLDGTLTLLLGDPDGLGDLDPTTLRWSYQLEEFSSFDLLAVSRPLSFTFETARFALVLPTHRAGQFTGVLSASLVDRSGQRTVTQRILQR